jgi:4-amino-4-deoxy-L-arabinose transferase-like glycosyltransferase
LSAVAFVGAHGLLLLALAATAWVAGRPLISAATPSDQRETGVHATTLGLVVLATAGCLLGLLGQLAIVPVLAVAAGLHLAGAAGWRELAAAYAQRDRSSPARLALRALVWLVLLAPVAVLALYPPLAFDETLYHLPFARAFAASGSLPFLPELRFPVFPQLAEVLSAEMLVVGGDVATHLVALLATLLAAALLVVWGNEWEGRGRSLAGWFAAAAWLGSPIVVYLSGTGYIEPLLALLVAAACWALWKWRRSSGRRWLVHSAVFAGAAASTKYLGLPFVVALALGVVLARRPPGNSPVADRMRDLGLFVAVALAVMAPWYGRIVALTDNPVFPYLSGIFGAHAWPPLRFDGMAPPTSAAEIVPRLIEQARRLATLPWDLVARRHLVGGLPPFSPVLLAGAPLIALGCLRERGLRPLLALVAGFVALFAILPADSRYLVTILPLVCLALGLSATHALSGVRLHWRARVAAAVAGLLLLPGWLYAGYRLWRLGPLPVTPPGREAFLSRQVPLYRAVARANRELQPEDTLYGLHAEQMRDYRRGEWAGDWYGPLRYGAVAPLLARPGALATVLRGADVELLLVPKTEGRAPRFAAALAASGFELVYEDGAALLYAVPPRGGRG